MLLWEMRRYYITAVKNKGRGAWMVSYPAKGDAGGRLRWNRKQNMFWNLEKAQAFLQEQKREQANNGSTLLAGDRLLHCDVLRALKILSTVPNASFEVAAWLLKMLSWGERIARCQVRGTDEATD